MANTVATPGRIFKNSTGTFMAKIIGADAAEIAQADISSIAYSVYGRDPDCEDTQTVVSGHDGVTLTVASVVFDTLQTDSRWTVDTTGYNFRFEIDTSEDEAFTVRGTKYLVHVELTPITGQVIDALWTIDCV